MNSSKNIHGFDSKHTGFVLPYMLFLKSVHFVLASSQNHLQYSWPKNKNKKWCSIIKIENGARKTIPGFILIVEIGPYFNKGYIFLFLLLQSVFVFNCSSCFGQLLEISFSYFTFLMLLKISLTWALILLLGKIDQRKLSQTEIFRQ